MTSLRMLQVLISRLWRSWEAPGWGFQKQFGCHMYSVSSLVSGSFSMPRARRKRIVWRTTDPNLLRNLAGRESAARIARELERTVQAVRFKAHVNRISLALRRSR
jgi:hypothetical protein